MESSWRRNVIELGLNDGYRYLASQEHAAPGFAILATTRYGGHFYEIAENIGGDQGWQVTGTPVIHPLFPHFPYNQIVNPDSHA